MKTIPLMKASLKQFMRNKRSILLLIVFPLLLISAIFLSFNQGGLREIPIGLIIPDSMNDQELENRLPQFLNITRFSKQESCLEELRAYQHYACIDVIPGDVIILNVSYDNTREPVIWEIVNLISASINRLQKQRSMEMASDFLTEFNKAIISIQAYKVEMVGIEANISENINLSDESIFRLRSAKTKLTETLREMNEDIDNIGDIAFELERSKAIMIRDSVSTIDDLDDAADAMSDLSPSSDLLRTRIRNGLGEVENDLEGFDSTADTYLNLIDEQLDQYGAKSGLGDYFVDEIDTHIRKLQDIKSDLLVFQRRLHTEQEKLSSIQEQMGKISELDPDILVNPVRISNRPTYVPQANERTTKRIQKVKGDPAQKAIKGFMFIGLQTIFPTLLLLIILFLSLLIASFLTLTEINSSANIRVSIIQGIAIHEYLSVFLSSLIIVIPPILSVLVLGHSLFLIPILDNLWLVALILFLLSATYILLGMALSYIIKKESITLLVSTFLLVFFIFFSGFLLPLERMAPLPGKLAALFPVNQALLAFNKVVFYSQGFSTIQQEVTGLALWFITLAILTFVIKSFMRRR